MKRKSTKKCRCYINAKYYARQARIGGNMKGWLPCPIHEKEDYEKVVKENYENALKELCNYDTKINRSK